MSSKGQLTVPKGLRERLRLRPGTRVQVFVDAHERLILVPALHRPEELFEHRPPVERVLSIADMDAAIGNALRDHSS